MIKSSDASIVAAGSKADGMPQSLAKPAEIEPTSATTERSADDDALEFWQRHGSYDPSTGLRALSERRAEGKALRDRVPREAHAEWSPAKDRPDPVAVLEESNRGRLPDLVPLRMARMAASPFAFLRGAACLMAGDLARSPVSGIHAVIDGDAHLSNFGLHGTLQRDVVFDLDDFDEATLGPWEFDLKRLAASVNVAGRDNGLNRRERRALVLACVREYRDSAARFQEMGILDLWYLHSYPGRKGSLRHLDPQTHAIFKRAVKKARDNTHARLLPRVAQREAGGSWRFIANLPTLSAIDDETASKVVVGLREYVETLTPERRYMMKRYRLAAVARRVVGVGSVGLRAYLALFFGNGESDPLFLQVKETTRPALADYVAPLPDILSHNGRRVVFGQRFLQASIDVLLGWTTIEGRHFFVRQMRNMKGSIPIAQLNGSTLGAYSRACGALLCRAHARTADIAKIAGYCGSSDALDQALADFAERYGDQNERDHAALVEAIKQGRVSSDS